MIFLDYKKFGVYLAEIREKSGYKSQRQLAIAAGIAPATLSRIEGGTQEPSPSTLKKLSVHLKDISYEDLMQAAGYIEESSEINVDTKNLNASFSPLDEINKLVKKYGVEDMGFFDIKEWENFGPEDIKMLDEQFKLIVKLAKERNKEK